MGAAPPFDSVFIANRGEIALRIIKTVKRLGARAALAVHRLDEDSPATLLADETIAIDADTPVGAYLDGDQLIKAAMRSGAAAIHPGYGFLSENAGFAKAVVEAGLTFIGPKPDVIALMGDKLAARAFVAGIDGPLLSSVEFTGDMSRFVADAKALGFPLLLKAAAGGGGKGMTIVRDRADLEEAATATARQASAFFGDQRIYCEQFIETPRHIEVQILADRHGACLHLFERECSVQRRFQKIIEEAPAPRLTPELRTEICAAAVRIASAAGYENAGTVEFILAPDGAYYFLEMNTRLQVEHPVTEMITGIDLVEAQLRIASGERLWLAQDEVKAVGWAIEARICAEDPDNDFLPESGPILVLKEPQGAGVRVDNGVAQGGQATPAFDPMLAKVIAHGQDRDIARRRLEAALGDFALLGVATNTDYLRRLVASAPFAAGALDTGFVERHGALLARSAPSEATLTWLLAAAGVARRHQNGPRGDMPAPYRDLVGWRN